MILCVDVHRGMSKPIKIGTHKGKTYYELEYVHKLRELLTKSYEDKKSLRLSGDCGFYDETELEKEIKEILF